MEISNALLVVMMFVVLLTMAIGSIVTALAVTVDRRSPLKFDRLHTGWMLLLLLVCFDMFWHVLDLLTIETWDFLGFLYIVGGAVIVLFASHVLVPDPTSEASADLRRHYFDVAPQFFMFLALLQVWVLGIDLVFGGGFVPDSAFNVVLGLIALALAMSKSPRIHQAGMLITALVLLSSWVHESMKVAS